MRGEPQGAAARRTRLLAELAYMEIVKAGCTTSSLLIERLRVTHNTLFYVLDMLRREGRVETANLGRVALWCASRTATETVLDKLTETLRSLLCGRRFATPKEALQLVAENRWARELFSRHVPLRLNPATVQIVDALMARAFGEPIKTARGRVYHVQCTSGENRQQRRTPP